MRALAALLLVASSGVAACSETAGTPGERLPLTGSETPAVASAASGSTASPMPSHPPRATGTPTPAEPLPEALIGAWYHPSPAYWWFLRAGSSTCIEIARTDLDCVTYQLGSEPAYVGAATMDGHVIRISWVRGYCAGSRTSFGVGLTGDTLRLFDQPDDCGGADEVLTRAGVGTTPTDPPPPER